MNGVWEMIIKLVEWVANLGVTSNSYVLWHEPEIPEALLEGKEQHD